MGFRHTPGDPGSSGPADKHRQEEDTGERVSWGQRMDGGTGAAAWV
ncbi:MAG: hypothetical protein LBG24_07990 [Treponema sp.]|nr:hypothetical protein [Treponema sp.]